MNRLWSAFTNLSLPTQVGVISAALFLLILICGGVGAVVSGYKDARFNRQIEGMKAERQAAIDKADAAEERAKAAESEKTKYQIAFELAGAKADAALQKVNDAEKKYNENLQSIDAPADPCERVNRIRASLKLAPVECAPTEESQR